MGSAARFSGELESGVAAGTGIKVGGTGNVVNSIGKACIPACRLAKRLVRFDQVVRPGSRTRKDIFVCNEMPAQDLAAAINHSIAARCSPWLASENVVGLAGGHVFLA